MSFFTFANIVTLTWIVRLVERVLFHVYRWQLKEYRWDRYRDYLTARQGILLLLHPWYWLGWLFLVLAVTVDKGIFLRFLPWYIFTSGILSVRNVLRGQLRFPTWTARSTLVYIVSMSVLIALPFLAPQANVSLYGLLGLPLLTAFVVFLTSFPAHFFKRQTIAKAKAKMASLPNLKVIGITGSYGKSSTKEFLSAILSKKYTVVKTPKNQNSEIGVAKTIIYNLKSEDEVFIVEMGAYRRGEIKAICDIVHPTIGVLTAVSEQHLALFGSLEEIKKAKYELIDALPENGLAVFNLDNSATRSLAEETLKPKRTYSLERPADVRASAITVQPEKFSFSVNTEDGPLDSRGPSSVRIEVNLPGAFQISSFLAAITVAHALGMTLEEIAEAVKTIMPLDHTMAPHHHKSGALIIDDSYSANPDGVLAALDHLKIIPRKYKVVVMMPMIELGSAAKDAHRRVGERMGHVCDLAIMTQKNYGRILRAASKLPSDKLLFLSSPKAILNALTPYLNANSVILLENRVPQKVIQELTQLIA